MEQEVMETVMHDILRQLKELDIQKRELLQLQEGMEAQHRIIISMEQKLAKMTALPFTLSDEQLTSLKAVIKREYDVLRVDVKKHPATLFNHKYYTVFGDRFGAEKFQVVVNTVMKWVIILIGSLSFISIIKFLLHYQ